MSAKKIKRVSLTYTDDLDVCAFISVLRSDGFHKSYYIFSDARSRRKAICRFARGQWMIQESRMRHESEKAQS